MIRHMAIDASLTATGWAATDAAYDIVHGTLTPRVRQGTRTRQLRGDQRLAWIAANIRALVRRHEPQFVAIEDYAYSRHSRAVTALAELGGVIRVALYGTGTPWIPISSSSIKLYATGNGNATKDAMVATAQDQLVYPGRSHDEADALWLHALISHALGMPRIRAEGRRLDALEPVTTTLDTIRPRPRSTT